MSIKLVLTSTWALIAFAIDIQLQLDRFEQTKGFHLVNGTGLRVRKFNRTTSVLTGAWDVFQDMGNEYSFKLTTAYSRLGNNQFNMYPMKVSKAKFCDMLNTVYKEYQPYFLNFTNLPRIGNEWFCPLPKERYWIKDFAPDSGWIPSVVPSGYWRMTGYLLDSTDEVVLRADAYLHVNKGYL